jgi:hypothetical protein
MLILTVLQGADGDASARWRVRLLCRTPHRSRALRRADRRLHRYEPAAAGQIGGLDTALDGFRATVAGLDENLLDDLPRIVRDLQRIEAPLTALERELDQACPTP